MQGQGGIEPDSFVYPNATLLLFLQPYGLFRMIAAAALQPASPGGLAGGCFYGFRQAARATTGGVGSL